MAMAPQSVPTQSLGGAADGSTPIAAGPSETTLSEALLTLRKRKWVLIVASIFGLAYGIYRVV